MFWHPIYGLSTWAFIILEKIGDGEYGFVYRVRKVSGEDAGACYAMKIQPKFCNDGRNLQRKLYAEYEILRMVRGQRYLSQLIYSFQTFDSVHFVLEYNRFGDFFKYFLEERRTLEPWNMEICLAEIACALNTLHLQGILHRDLKLENLMIGRDGHVVLGDFGLCVKTRDGRAWGVVGTFGYMAPEVLNNRQYSSAADFWSLGIVLHEMVARQHPFDPTYSMGRDELCRAIRERHPNFFEGIFSDSLKNILKGLLQKKPHERLTYKDLKSDSYFTVTTWPAVERGRAPPPFFNVLRNFIYS